MKEFKTFKKILSITLAGAMLSQTSLAPCKAENAKPSASSKVLGTLAAAAGIAVVGLTVGLTHKANEVEKQKERVQQLNDEMHKLQERIANPQNNGVSPSEYQALKEKHTQLQAELDKARAELAKAEQDFENEKSEHQKTTSELNEARSDAAAKTAELSSVRDERDRYERDLRSTQQALDSKRADNEKLTNDRKLLLMHSIADRCIAIAPQSPALKEHLDKLSIYLGHSITPKDIWKMLDNLPRARGTACPNIWLAVCGFVMPKDGQERINIADATWFHSAHMITELLNSLGNSEVEQIQKEFLNNIIKLKSNYFKIYCESWPELTKFEEQYIREHTNQTQFKLTRIIPQD